LGVGRRRGGACPALHTFGHIREGRGKHRPYTTSTPLRSHIPDISEQFGVAASPVLNYFLKSAVYSLSVCSHMRSMLKCEARS